MPQPQPIPTPGQTQATHPSATPSPRPQPSATADPNAPVDDGGALLNGLADAEQSGINAAKDVGDIATQAAQWGVKAVKGLDPLAGIAAGLTAMAAPAMEIGKVADWVFKLSLPSTWIRLLSWVAAAFCLTFGIVLLARELKTK